MSEETTPTLDKAPTAQVEPTAKHPRGRPRVYPILQPGQSTIIAVAPENKKLAISKRNASQISARRYGYKVKTKFLYVEDGNRKSGINGIEVTREAV